MDVGRGSGCFSFKVSDIVGERGNIYLADTQEPHVDYIEALVKKRGTNNVIPNLSSHGDLGPEINDGTDVVSMCALYHIL